jgi:threonine synthase
LPRLSIPRSQHCWTSQQWHNGQQGAAGDRFVVPEVAFQRCISPDCGETYALDDARVACSRCGELVDVAYHWDQAEPPKSLNAFEAKWARRSDPLCSACGGSASCCPFAPPEKIVTVGEGQTLLQQADAVAKYVGLNPGRLFLQYEG